MLGVPVGNADFVEHFFNDVIFKLSNMAARIDMLKSNIAKFLLPVEQTTSCALSPFDMASHWQKRPQ